MPIREKGYHSWEGDLIEGHKSWTTIAQHGIRQVFRKKFSKIIFFASSITFLVFLFIVYAIAKPELKMFTKAVAALQTDASMINMYLNIGPFVFMLLFLLMFAGAGMISQDIRFKSFTLYFSRPVSRIDYIKGKLSSVLFFYLAFTLVPALFLLFEKMVLSGNFSVEPRAVLGAIVYPIVVGIYLSSLILLLSSITGNTKMVYIMIFGALYVPEIIANIFRATFDSDYFMFLSIWTNLKQFGSWIFGVEPAVAIPAWISGLVLVAGILIFNSVLYGRLGKVEV